MILKMAIMSATVMSDATGISSTEPQAVTTKLAAQMEVEFAKCDCCELTEECTPAYIERIRERYQGKWICGLCAEAVKDEIVRCQKLISTEEALALHINFCKKFNSAGPPANPTVLLISAIRQILRRSLDNPRSLRSMPCSPTAGAGSNDRPVLSRSGSCIPTLSVVDSPSYQGIEESNE